MATARTDGLNKGGARHLPQHKAESDHSHTQGKQSAGGTLNGKHEGLVSLDHAAQFKHEGLVSLDHAAQLAVCGRRVVVVGVASVH